MKVLHLNYHQNQGGASIACNRLVQALNLSDIKSELLVSQKMNESKTTIGQFNNFNEISVHKLKKILSIYIKKILKSENIYKDSIAFFNSGLPKIIEKLDHDIINLHWVSNEMISIEEIGKIKKPLVWTLLDMWPFIGSAHYTNKNYFSKINNKTSFFDINEWVLNRKKKNFHRDIRIVCISNWLKKQVEESEVLKNNVIETIPCTLDTNTWKPIEKNLAREILCLEKNKKYILFSAFNGINDERKGFDLLLKSLEKIKLKPQDFTVVIIGKSSSLKDFKISSKYKFKRYENFFNGGDLPLRLIYSACDLVVMPSRLEAFGQVPLEAGSCGVPCVSFKETGAEDIIDHKINGYLANYLSIEDLSKGIDFLLEEKNNSNLSVEIRKKVENNFSYEQISKKYKKIYDEIAK